MADYDLTLSRAAIPDLLEQPAALSRLVQTILNQVLEAQVSEHLGAEVAPSGIQIITRERSLMDLTPILLRR